MRGCRDDRKIRILPGRDRTDDHSAAGSITSHAFLSPVPCFIFLHQPQSGFRTSHGESRGLFRSHFCKYRCKEDAARRPCGASLAALLFCLLYRVCMPQGARPVMSVHLSSLTTRSDLPSQRFLWCRTWCFSQWSDTLMRSHSVPCRRGQPHWQGR